MEVDLKFYLYQLLAVIIVWSGMTYFLENIEGAGRIIYYAVTSWLLFLIVLTVKKWFADKRKQNEEK